MADASPVVYHDEKYGHTASNWRPHNMQKTRSSLSPTTMITCLQTILFLREHYSCLLSDSERALLSKFVITVAESMAHKLPDHIITSPCSTITDVTMELPAEHICLENVAIAARLFRTLGAKAQYCRENSHHTVLHTLQDMLRKSISLDQKMIRDIQSSQECH